MDNNDLNNKRKFNVGAAAKAAAYVRQQEELASRRADVRARLAAKAESDPDGIWSGLLEEHDARNLNNE